MTDDGKVDQHCSAYRRISVDLANITSVPEDTALFDSAMTIKAGVTYTVQTGYKLWASDSATQPISEADGALFELFVADSAFYFSTGLALLTYLITI